MYWQEQTWGPSLSQQGLEMAHIRMKPWLSGYVECMGFHGLYNSDMSYLEIQRCGKPLRAQKELNLALPRDSSRKNGSRAWSNLKQRMRSWGPSWQITVVQHIHGLRGEGKQCVNAKFGSWGKQVSGMWGAGRQSTSYWSLRMLQGPACLDCKEEKENLSTSEKCSLLAFKVSVGGVFHFCAVGRDALWWPSAFSLKWLVVMEVSLLSILTASETHILDRRGL